MDMVVAGIALVVWLLLMVPAALVMFLRTDLTNPDTNRIPGNVAQLPRPELRDEDRVAA